MHACVPARAGECGDVCECVYVCVCVYMPMHARVDLHVCVICCITVVSACDADHSALVSTRVHAWNHA